MKVKISIAAEDYQKFFSGDTVKITDNTGIAVEGNFKDFKVMPCGVRDGKPVAMVQLIKA